jgi:hypothetical protein
MIPEIDIWRVAGLMLKRYGGEADIESAIPAGELLRGGRLQIGMAEIKSESVADFFLESVADLLRNQH